ncbi:ABC transporter permease [Butyricicoccus sp. OF10-2]|nr:ABC transporter permease [Butyricicoccus sp. OF10-2]
MRRYRIGYSGSQAELCTVGCRSGLRDGCDRILCYRRYSLLGGFGSVWGTFVGSIIMIVIRNGLNLLNVSSNLQKLVIGVVILLAVLADSIRNKAAAKK